MELEFTHQTCHNYNSSSNSERNWEGGVASKNKLVRILAVSAVGFIACRAFPQTSSFQQAIITIASSTGICAGAFVAIGTRTFDADRIDDNRMCWRTTSNTEAIVKDISVNAWGTSQKRSTGWAISRAGDTFVASVEKFLWALIETGVLVKDAIFARKASIWAILASFARILTINAGFCEKVHK